MVLGGGYLSGGSSTLNASSETLSVYAPVNGENSGVLQTVTAPNKANLPSGYSEVVNFYNGQSITVFDPAGDYVYYHTITAFNRSTGEITVSPNWNAAVDNTYRWRVKPKSVLVNDLGKTQLTIGNGGTSIVEMNTREIRKTMLSGEANYSPDVGFLQADSATHLILNSTADTNGATIQDMYPTSTSFSNQVVYQAYDSGTKYLESRIGINAAAEESVTYNPSDDPTLEIDLTSFMGRNWLQEFKNVNISLFLNWSQSTGTVPGNFAVWEIPGTASTVRYNQNRQSGSVYDTVYFVNAGDLAVPLIQEPSSSLSGAYLGVVASSLTFSEIGNSYRMFADQSAYLSVTVSPVASNFTGALYNAFTTVKIKWFLNNSGGMNYAAYSNQVTSVSPANPIVYTVAVRGW